MKTRLNKRRRSGGDGKARWQALVERDPKADGTFYYAVRSTGVYCKPSCASRLPLRKNVLFFESAAAAAEAGFRPCKRCRPGGPGLKEEYAAKAAKACRIIDAAEKVPDLASLARAVGMSPHHFHRVFKSQTGLTPKAYAMARRSRQTRRELAGRGTVTEAIYGAGFNSSGRFYAQSSRILGMTPGEYREGGKGAVIRFAVAGSLLGSVLVAASGKGVCAVSIGDNSRVLFQELRDQFPKARLVGGDESFEKTVADVVAWIEGSGTGLDLPLDLRGTAFQQKVWNALRKIPPGKTVSYTELAARVGKPKAVRAVAGACAANKIAVLVPCHRVLRQDGGLSGYRWGAERKTALLKRETEA